MVQRNSWRERAKKRRPEKIYRKTPKGPERFCPDCETWKPANRRYFYRNSSAPDRCYVVCIPCKNIRQVEYELNNPHKSGAISKATLEEIDYKEWLESQRERILEYGG